MEVMWARRKGLVDKTEGCGWLVSALGGQSAKTRAETQPSVSPTRGRSSAAAYDVTGKDPSGVWHERKKTSTAAPAG